MSTTIVSLIWCLIGAAAGYAAFSMKPTAVLSGRIENMLVGAFGAYVGGESTAYLTHAAADAGFQPLSIALALVGAVTMLVLLALMRRVVGPMNTPKPKKRQ